MSERSNKTAVFIDGSNLHAAAQMIGMDIDFRKVLDFFRAKYDLVRAYYYTSILADEDGYAGLNKLVDWLDFNGFTVVSKEAKQFVDANGRSRVKGCMDVELAVDVMNMADRVDEIVIFSGDGNLRYLIEAVQRKGVKVTIISTKETNPPVAAESIRRQADEFIDLTALRPLIDKTFTAESSARHVKSWRSS